MSGTVLPEFGSIAKVIVVLLVFLGIEYIGVIVKLSLFDTHSVTARIVFGLITPGLLLLAFIISNLLDDKTANVIVFFLLAGINMIYLLLPLCKHLAQLIYSGSDNIIAILTVGLISIITSVLILTVFVTGVYFIVKK